MDSPVKQRIAWCAGAQASWRPAQMMKDGRLSTQSLEYSSLTHLPRTMHFCEDLIFILLQLFSGPFFNFIESVLQEIPQAHPGAFCDDAGRYGSRNLRVGTICRCFVKHWCVGSGFKEKVTQQGEPQRRRSETPSTISANNLQRN